jgi:phosphotriesterase-related protein
MASIETVTGPLDIEDLGVVLMHEHVTHYSDQMRQQWPHLHSYETEPVDIAVAALSEAKKLGVDTVVDCTTPNMGRQVRQMEEVSERTSVNIIFSTGYQSIIGPDIYFRLNRGVGLSIDELAAMFEYDIVNGAQGTGRKAGVIKVGTSPGADEWQESALRAAARAHRRTGVPITTHSEPSLKDGLIQLDILESEGVDLSHVVVGHSGDSRDLAYLAALVARGCYLGMDRFGFMLETLRETLQTEERIAIVKGMCERGAVGQMVLSHDALVWCDYLPPDYIATANPEWNINYLSKEAFPMMLAAGISQAQLDTMLRQNPAQILERVEPY